MNNSTKLYVMNAVNERVKQDKHLAWLPDNIIFLSVHGSISYGLNIETSDIDMTGVCIPPIKYFLGFEDNLEQVQFTKPDGQIYGIQKFLRLAADNNPNVMELLWLDRQYWIYSSLIWEKLVKKRDLFLSKRVRYTYSGYAIAQLKRIETHRKWLLDPPTCAPTREKFNLPPDRIMSHDQQGALDQLVTDGKVSLEDNFMLLLQKEHEYDRAKQSWKQYETWVATRNPARAENEKKFGYDTKHAAHLVRLISQCFEILKNGTLHVDRSDLDKELLLGIRNGAWTYNELRNWVVD